MDENNNPIQEPGVKTEEPISNETTQNIENKKQNTMGLISFIFSLIGLIIAAIACGVVALVTGIIGIVKFDPSKDKGKGLAIAGVVIGAIDIIAGIINVASQLTSLAL